MIDLLFIHLHQHVHSSHWKTQSTVLKILHFSCVETLSLSCYPTVASQASVEVHFEDVHLWNTSAFHPVSRVLVRTHSPTVHFSAVVQLFRTRLVHSYSCLHNLVSISLFPTLLTVSSKHVHSDVINRMLFLSFLFLFLFLCIFKNIQLKTINIFILITIFIYCHINFILYGSNMSYSQCNKLIND